MFSARKRRLTKFYSPLAVFTAPTTYQDMCQKQFFVVPVPMTARSKEWACGLSIAVIAGSNLARGMDVRLFC